MIAEALATSTTDPAVAENAIVEKLGGYAKNIEEHQPKGVAHQSAWQYEGIDLSPAPLKRDSIGARDRIVHGRMARFKRHDFRGGADYPRGAVDFRGARRAIRDLMLPVMEDSIIARRWSEGSLNVDGLLAYSARSAARGSM